MTAGIVDALQFALDSVNADLNAVSNNLANSSTPDYSAQRVNFESSLSQALASQGSATATSDIVASTAPPNVEGNNVDMGAQIIAAEHDALRYQQLSESLTAQFRLIRGASGGSYQ